MKVALLAVFFFFVLFEVPFGMNVNLAPGLSPKNLLLYILLVSVVLSASIRAQEFRIDPVSIHVPFVSLIIVTVFSWAISAVAYKSIDYPIATSFMELKSSTVDHYVIMIVFIYALTTREEVMKVARALVAIVVFSTFLTFLELLNIVNIGIIEERMDGRVQGPIGQANQYGGFLSFWFPVCVSAYVASRSRWRTILGVASLITLGLLVLTGSRGALVGSISGALFGVVILRRYLPRKVVLKGSMAVIAVAVGVLLVVSIQFADMIEARIEKTTSGDAQQVTAGRVEIWTKALETMADNPVSFLYGNGWLSFRLVLDKGAHNMYLEKLFELGLLGLFIYLALLAAIITFLRSAIRSAEEPYRTYLFGVVFALCAVSVSTFFSELYRPWMLIWAYIGVMIRLAMLQRIRPPETEREVK